MAIAYTPAQWDALRARYAAWRENDDGAPLLGWESFRDPGRPKPDAPLLCQACCMDFSWSAEQLADTISYHLEQRVYGGSAYPRFSMDVFGPGVLAAFCGADMELSSTNNIWFKTPEKPIGQITIRFDEDNRWFRRVRSIFEACARRFEGNAVLTMTDLGGAADVVATFVGSQALLYALYDEPDEVKRLMQEAHEAWWQAYRLLNGCLEGAMPGYSDWFGVYYPEPGGYILQSDFSYMISPAMFREFIQPELAASAQKLAWPLYHWDGPGELVHFDALMEINPRLQAIQWVPGDGQPPQQAWPEVLEKLGRAGRKILLYDGGPQDTESVFRLPGVRPGQVYHSPYWIHPGQIRDYDAWLDQWGAR